jgi:hypothetical protein
MSDEDGCILVLGVTDEDWTLAFTRHGIDALQELIAACSQLDLDLATQTAALTGCIPLASLAQIAAHLCSGLFSRRRARRDGVPAQPSAYEPMTLVEIWTVMDGKPHGGDLCIGPLNPVSQMRRQQEVVTRPQLPWTRITLDQQSGRA